MTCSFCNNVSDRTFVRGTTEYLVGWVDATETLDDTIPIQISFDRVGWHDAEWLGDPSTHRHWQILLGDDVPLPNSNSIVYARVTDNPEIPWLKAGNVKVI